MAQQYSQDAYDEEVLKVLISGEVYTAGQLRQLYRVRTDIKTKQTAKRHMKLLVDHGPFENVAWGKWKFLGVDSE